MPRYYVDTSDEETFVLDDIGLEVADLEAAKNAAVDSESSEVGLRAPAPSIIWEIRDRLQ